MKQSYRVPFPSLFVALVAVAGCSTTLEGAPSGGSGGGGGASADEAARCKESCDKMKFFDCSSAEEQARCYADCDSATSSQIEVFTGCAENSICDPSCRTTIQPKADGQTSEGGGGASSSSCADACSKLVTCNAIPAAAKTACASECTAKGYQYQIDCVNNAECTEIESACGGGQGPADIDIDIGRPEADPVEACLEECDSMSFFDCGTAASFTACRKACASADDEARDTFTACSSSSGPRCEKKEACLGELLK